MSVRQMIADQIAADNPTYVVKAQLAFAPDNLVGTRVHVFRKTLTKNPSSLTHECTIEVMIGKNDEDLLDEVLDEVLLSVERIEGVTWTSSDRRVFDDKYHGYEITCSANSTNTYKQIILDERA